MKISYLVLGLVLAVLVEYSVQWSGNVCSRTICKYRRERRCAYRTWAGCCAWRWYWVPDYTIVYFCCAGWTTSSSQRCDRAICNPSCKNGGTCVRPNVCRCTDGAIGSRCNTLVCNWQRPCFPGNCIPSGSQPLCNCKSGFQTQPSGDSSNFCRGLNSDQKPEIFAVQARMSFWPRGMTPSMEKYALYVDSTMTDEVDFIWTNRREFNNLNVTASAQYVNSEINSTMSPPFISNYSVGIGQAEAQLLLEKTPYQGSNFTSKFISLNETLDCSPAVSDSSPTSDTYYCDIKRPNFDRSLENGDNLTIIFKVWSGGFRDLQEISLTRAVPRGKQNFYGHLTEKAMAYRFDFIKPTHSCLETTGTCSSNTAFYMDADVTTNEIILRWSDWTDAMSGMFRYAWEVFKLEVDGNPILREHNPLGPIHGPIEVNQSSFPSSFLFEVPYTPPEPGVYSFILEASDRANNSIFVRRIAIYDPTSSVTTDSAPDRRLYISSANPNGDYNWQQDINQPTEVTWTNHFVNRVHEQGKWLNQVKAYPRELEDALKTIDRNSSYDDHEGKRTVDEIPNRRGIVKFQIAKRKDSKSGRNQTTPTYTEWIDVSLNDTYIFDADPTQTNLDTVTVWVKATDVLGNTRVEFTRVHFDNTSPDATNASFARDVQSNNVPYSSTVKLTVLDMQSGMKRVDFTVLKKGTLHVVSNHTMRIPSIPKSSCTSVAEGCYCPPALDPNCYNKAQTLAISNCMLWVEKELGDSQSVDVIMDFMNMAGLVTSRSIQVADVGLLNGTRTYIGPMKLKASDVTETTVTVSWTHSPSCYNRTEMWINYLKGSELIMTQLHHSALSYNLAGLTPGTSYTIELISQYGEVKSDPVPIIVVTVGSGLSAGAVAGIVIGVLLFLILILIIVGLILFKLGMLAGIVNRRKKYTENTRVEAPIVHTNTIKQNNHVSRWAFENTTYNKDEEIYIYGSMDLGEPWYIPPDDLTLTEEIATGRFAKIYKAKWRESPKNIKEVAAKILKARESEDNIMLMLAKINFASSQVGEHRNILGFLGAVMENDALGPVMILEYCESGQLDKWLVKKRSDVSEDVLDRIQNFALEIGRAMEYLASKGIVHRKLAARNCLLTFLLEIKVTGFGPCQTDDSGDDSKGDRIPIKWTAPECLKTLKNADEKSDAWSYGVTLWEIFSMGGSPYSDIRGRDLPTKVKSGYRMSRPEYAEDIHYELMQKCWADFPTQRPTFRETVTTLETSFGLRPDGGDQNYYYQR